MKLLQIAKDVFYLLITIVLIPIILILLTPVLVYRSFVLFSAKCSKKSLRSPFQSLDSYFLFLDEELHHAPHVIISSLFHLNGDFNPTLIKEKLHQLIYETRRNGTLRYERLQQHPKIWLGYAFFESDKDFNLEDHLVFLDNGDYNFEEDNKEFTIFCLARSLQEGKSLWDIVFLQNFRGKTLMFARFHHSVCDGYSVLKLLNSAMGLHPEKFHKPGNSNQKSWNLSTLYERTIGLPNNVITFLSSIIELDKEINALAKFPILKNAVSPGWCFYATLEPIPWETIRVVKNYVDAPVVTVLALALREALNTHFMENVDEYTHLPETLYFKIPVPSDGHNNDRLQNKFRFVLPDLPMNTTSSHFKNGYLKQKFRRDLTQSQYVSTCLTILNLFPLQLFKRIFFSIPFRNEISLAVTSMPGPTKEIHLWDNVVECATFTAIADPLVPIIVSMISYNGVARITLSAHSTLIKDQILLEKLCTNIGIVIESMHTDI